MEDKFKDQMTETTMIGKEQAELIQGKLYNDNKQTDEKDLMDDQRHVENISGTKI